MRKSIVGIDIGTKSIKAVEIEKKKSSSLLKAVGEIKIPPSLSATITDEGIATLSSYVRKLISDTGIKTKQAVSAFPSEKAYVNIIDLPPMPKRELANAMKWQLSRHVSGYPEEKSAFWDILKEDTRGYKILIIAADGILISKYLNIVRGSGLKSISLEIEPIALARSLSRDNKDAILVDIGGSFTSCSLIDNGGLDLTRNLKVGVDKLVNVVSRATKDDADPKNALFEYGLLKFKSQDVYHAIIPYINQVSSELKRLISFYEEKNKKELKKIVLSGGGALIPDLANHFIKEVSKDVVLANPWKGLDIASNINSEDLVSIGPSFSTAVGLAMLGR